MRIDRRSYPRRIWSFAFLILLGLEAIFIGPQRLPDLVAYSGGALLIFLGLGGITSVVAERSKKRSTDITRKT